MRGREVREAARNINVYVKNAQARAKELGRPVGIVIDRSPNDPNLGYQLSLAEEVPPFTGWTAFSKAKVNGDMAQVVEVLGPGNESQSILTAVDVQPNDQIRFNYRGQRYRVRRVIPNTATIQFEMDGVDTTRHTISPNHAVPFEVFRRPRKTLSTPLELPTGTAVVLSLSGVGLTGNLEESRLSASIGLTEFQSVDESVLANAPFQARDMPLTIMFTPENEVDRVYRVLPPPNVNWPAYRNFPPKRPQAKIFLFLGKDTLDPLNNLVDGTNLWITIDPHSGSVTTAPNGVAVDDISTLESSDLRATIASSRQLAATGQSIGGR